MRTAYQVIITDAESNWRSFDRLPAQVRRALQEAVGPFSPEDAGKACQDFGPDVAVKIIQAASQSECRVWNDAYRSRYGHDTPAHAARATIQPYGRRA